MNAFIRRNLLELFSLFLICLSGVYFFGALQKKKELLRGRPDKFADGQLVSITEVIDGDELQITSDDGAKAPIRLIGIMSFHPSISDKLEKKYAQNCIDYLKQRCLSQKAILKLGKLKIDSKGRLLGELFLKNDENSHTINLSKELVAKGYSLVYTRYNFPNMKEFQKVEETASKELLGFWANQQMRARAMELKAAWSEGSKK